MTGTCAHVHVYTRAYALTRTHTGDDPDSQGHESGGQALQGRLVRRYKFSNVKAPYMLCRKCAKALTFEKFRRADDQERSSQNLGAQCSLR
jgi:uncharacterized CHY-type Zn-finger protein